MSKSKYKVPKRIAGVKIPKPLRKRANAVARFAETPLGSAMIAQIAVSAVGGVVRNERVRAAMADAGRDIGQLASVTAARLGAVVTATRDAAMSSFEDSETATLRPTIKGERVDLPH